MLKLILVFSLFLLTSCSTTYYIVRHAEKEAPNNAMTSDVPLSSMGKERAESLKSELQNNKIKRIYSTNYIRTKSTAQPLSDAIGVNIEIYDPKDSAFINRLRSTGKGNTLIVGHSNTVDDLVNQLTGKNLLQDLPDSQYGDLFIIKKKGNSYHYEKKHFGK